MLFHATPTLLFVPKPQIIERYAHMSSHSLLSALHRGIFVSSMFDDVYLEGGFGEGSAPDPDPDLDSDPGPNPDP